MKWRCKDGRSIELSDMETSHLHNTVNMLRRKGFVTPEDFDACARYAYSPMSGDYAAMAAEQELLRSHPSRQLAQLEAELAERKGKH